MRDNLLRITESSLSMEAKMSAINCRNANAIAIQPKVYKERAAWPGKHTFSKGRNIKSQS